MCERVSHDRSTQACCEGGKTIGGGIDLILPAAISAAIVGLFLLALYLMATHNGMIANNPGADWSHHAALTDVIVQGGDIEQHRPQLNEFSDQPRFAHIFAAALAKATGLSPLQTIHIVATISIIVSILILSLRITSLALSGYNLAGVLSGLFAGAAVVFVATKLTIGFNGQLQYNFFFHQAVGTAAAMFALTGVQRGVAAGGRTLDITLFCVPFLTLALAKIHTAPALWFAAAGGLCALSNGGPLWKRFLTTVGVGIACIVLLLLDPATRSILALGQSGTGDLNMFLAGALWKLNTHGGALAMGLLLMGTLLWLLAYMRRNDHVLHTIFNVHVGAVALVIVAGSVLVAMVLLKNKEFYAVGKYVYLFAAEAAILAAGIFAFVGDRLGRRFARGYPNFNQLLPLRIRTVSQAFVICLLTITLITLPQESWAWRWTADQTFLVNLREDILRSRAALPSPVPYPLAGDLRSQERYYLYISPMGQPRDVTAYSLLTDPNFGLDLNTASRAIPASLTPLAAPIWQGDAAEFAVLSPPNPILLFGRWSPPAGFGRWASTPAAHLQFRVAPSNQDRQLCLQITTPALGDHVTLNVDLLLNGTSVYTDLFKNGSEDRVVSVPLKSLNRRGDVLLSFLAEFAPPMDGAGISVGLRTMWIAANCN